MEDEKFVTHISLKAYKDLMDFIEYCKSPKINIEADNLINVDYKLVLKTLLDQLRDNAIIVRRKVINE
jgi:hypothetical protein